MRKDIGLSIFIAILGQNIFAATGFTPHDADEAALSSYMNRPTARSHMGSGTWSLVIPSFVIHGVQVDTEAAAAMPRKTDASGSTVVTPGAGLQYVSGDGNMLIAAVVKDCYDDLAGTLQVGRSFRITRSTSWGLTAGVYMRETPLSCDNTGPGGSVSCRTLDSYPFKWLATINGESVDVIPMPFVHFQTTLYRDRDVRIDFKFMSNVVLNEFGLSFPF